MPPFIKFKRKNKQGCECCNPVMDTSYAEQLYSALFPPESLTPHFQIFLICFFYNLFLVGETEKMIDFMEFVISGIYKKFFSLRSAMIIISRHQILMYFFCNDIFRYSKIIVALADIFYDGRPYSCFFMYLA